jgi:hypothetical protein
MPSTDRKLELKAKTSVAQTDSQPCVYAKGLTTSSFTSRVCVSRCVSPDSCCCNETLRCPQPLLLSRQRTVGKNRNKKIHNKLFKNIYMCVCNETQPAALFILNLFRQSTSTCFGFIYCPSSRGIHCIYKCI